METTGQSDEIEFEGYEHTVQLLEKGGAGAKLPAVFETDDTTTWSLRDSQGCLLNLSWQILTTFPELQRVLNHRPCDQRHKHGRLPDRFSAFSLQFPQSLCQTLAKQFLVKDSWNSALGILEQLHADDDERPFDPFASSCENPVGLDAAPSEMNIDRNVDMPPSEPPVVEASPTVSEETISPICCRKFFNRSDIVTTAHL